MEERAAPPPKPKKTPAAPSKPAWAMTEDEAEEAEDEEAYISWCECGKDEATCASAGGEWQCEAYGPMAFKGFAPPEACDYDEDCTPGWGAIECLNDGTLMYAEGCSSCDDCDDELCKGAQGGQEVRVRVLGSAACAYRCGLYH